MLGRRTLRPSIAVAIAGALTVGACDGGGDPTPTTVAPAITTTTVASRGSDGVLTIGVLLPKTGPGATLGAGLIDAVEIAASDINAAGGVLGQGIRIEEADEADSGAMNQLIDLGVDAIVGPASSLVALEQLATAVEHQVVVCSPTATAIALDDYPDDGWFFRTAPSDSLQMAAIDYTARQTGASTLAIAYLDDPYGRALQDSLASRVRQGGQLTIVDETPFASTDADLSGAARAVLAGGPDVVVVLAGGDDGGRMLAALDDARGTHPELQSVIVNDAVRTARQVIAGLSTEFRQKLVGVAPRAVVDSVPGFFAAHAIDCVNLIALAAVRAATDRPIDFRRQIGVISYGGAQCASFSSCVALLDDGSRIDYTGLSGPVDMRAVGGDLTSGRFDSFRFGDNGTEVEVTAIPVSATAAAATAP